MKLAIYKDNLSTGRGADHLVCAQAEGLAELGYDTTLVTCPTDRPYTFDVGKNVKTAIVERTKVCDFIADFDVCIAAGSNEILDLTQNGKTKPPVKSITEMLVAPLGFFKWKRFIRNHRIKKAFNLSDALVILCRAYEKEVRKFAPLPRIATIAEWPDTREPTKEELADEKRTKTIIYPAAVNKMKNQLLLIRAFANLADEFPEWRLDIIGRHNKKYGAKCVGEVEKRLLGNRIGFLPFTSDLPSVYASAEIMAFPSLLEGFPLTIIEGAKFGLPAVVVDKLPGASDMIRDGENGIIAPNTVDGYANALRKLMSDDVLRRNMGDKAREICNNVHTKANVMAKWDNLIKEIYNKKEPQDE